MISLTGYKVADQLYESSHSLIYRGFRDTDQLPIILKMLKKEYPTPREWARFRMEFETWSWLRTKASKPDMLNRFQ